MDEKQAENLRIAIHHMRNVCNRTLDMAAFHRCGTPACAAGELACHPHFRRLGFGLSGEMSLLTFHGKATGSGELAAEVLGLTEEERVELFCGYEPEYVQNNFWKRNNVTPAEWADHAETILRKHGYPATAPTKQPERIEAIDPALTALLKRMNVREPA